MSIGEKTASHGAARGDARKERKQRELGVNDSSLGQETERLLKTNGGGRRESQIDRSLRALGGGEVERALRLGWGVYFITTTRREYREAKKEEISQTWGPKTGGTRRKVGGALVGVRVGVGWKKRGGSDKSITHGKGGGGDLPGEWTEHII